MHQPQTGFNDLVGLDDVFLKLELAGFDF